MKNKASTLISVFAAGFVIGAALLWLIFSYRSAPQWFGTKNTPPIDTTGVTKVDSNVANGYFNTYYGHPDTVMAIKGFSLSKAQVNAMRLIAKKHPKVHGFRVYYGMKNMKPVWIIVGTGSPELTDEVYVTDDAGCGPCPNLCDTESPITKPKD
ncbi:MAG TPA: hypothetical protein PKG48_01720 [Bacteroidales bacterium]|nr:hypothetical protein [Bacteroidales bacterium]HPS61776.1 hypothetical protein [Bacteroidales bacterium]